MGLFDRIRDDDEPRVAFFGIDGVPYTLLSDHPEEFPNLAALAEEGTAGAIDSIVPPESSACWPALTTGKNPGATGVYGFQDREVGSYDTYVPMGRDVQADRLWDRVQRDGRDATVMNVPVTFPPQRNVQRMVSGFLSPGLDKAAYPDELRETLESVDYRIDADAGLGKDGDKSAFMENAHETLDARFEAFEHYVEQDDWDLFFGVFMTPDRVNHFLFKDYERDGEYYEEFMDFYRKLDDYLGTLREKLADDVTMLVASDHGFTSLDHEVHCNEWLREQGWLSYRHDYALRLNSWVEEHDDLELGEDAFADAAPGQGDLSLAADADVAMDAGGADVSPDIGEADPVVDAADPDDDSVAVVVAADEVAKNRVVDELPELTADEFGVDDDRDLVARVDATQVDVEEETDDGGTEVVDTEYHVTVETTDRVAAEDAVDPDDDLDEADGDVLGPGHTGLGDISDETKAYSLIPGRFYLNLEGREPRGSVPQDEYDEVRDELKAMLEDLEGPDGEPVADRVVEGEEVFDGDHDAIAPDLVVVPNHGFDLKAGFKGRDHIFDPGPRDGMHSFDNASLFVDDPDATIEDVDLYDIAPTILDLLEVDYDSAALDGESLV